jgi:hypothetical protein
MIASTLVYYLQSSAPWSHSYLILSHQKTTASLQDILTIVYLFFNFYFYFYFSITIKYSHSHCSYYSHLVIIYVYIEKMRKWRRVVLRIAFCV